MIFMKFSRNVGNGKNYKWFNFGNDPEGILDSGLVWNLCRITNYAWRKSALCECFSSTATDFQRL